MYVPPKQTAGSPENGGALGILEIPDLVSPSFPGSKNNYQVTAIPNFVPLQMLFSMFFFCGEFIRKSLMYVACLFIQFILQCCL